jgi:hypothetical protein
MPDRNEAEEPLQALPPGMARRYAEYKPATDEPSPPPTNVGGYDELLNYVRGKGMALPRSREGLAVIDALSEDPEAKKDLTGLTAAIGMFYGDVLTHAIPGAHWEVVEEGSPTVRISRNTSVSVIHVAQRRISVGLPTLAMNYDHALDHIGRDEPQGM